MARISPITRGTPDFFGRWLCNPSSIRPETNMPNLRLSEQEAAAITAYLMSLEDKQGSIEVGKRADLIVLDRNLFEIPAAEISEANVTMTIFDGRIIYEMSR